MFGFYVCSPVRPCALALRFLLSFRMRMHCNEINEYVCVARKCYNNNTQKSHRLGICLKWESQEERHTRPLRRMGTEGMERKNTFRITDNMCIACAAAIAVMVESRTKALNPIENKWTLNSDPWRRHRHVICLRRGTGKLLRQTCALRCGHECVWLLCKSAFRQTEERRTNHMWMEAHRAQPLCC